MMKLDLAEEIRQATMQPHEVDLVSRVVAYQRGPTSAEFARLVEDAIGNRWTLRHTVEALLKAYAAPSGDDVTTAVR